MIELIYGGRGEGKTVEAIRHAASWIRTGGSVLFLTTTRYSASHVEQVADLIGHEASQVRGRFTSWSVANIGEIHAKLDSTERDGLLVVIDGASELVDNVISDLRKSGVRPGLSEMLALTFALGRSIEARGFRVVLTLAGD